MRPNSYVTFVKLDHDSSSDELVSKAMEESKRRTTEKRNGEGNEIDEIVSQGGRAWEARVRENGHEIPTLQTASATCSAED